MEKENKIQALEKEIKMINATIWNLEMADRLYGAEKELWEQLTRKRISLYATYNKLIDNN